MQKQRNSQRIIGLDPGLARTGYACLEYTKTAMRLLTYGCIETDKKEQYSTRLMQIERQLAGVLKKYTPRAAAMEKLFFYKNVTTAMDVGQARGVIMLTLGHQRLVPIELTPQQIKLAATGYGNADKKQIQQMMQRILGLSSIPKPDDAADAIAIAYAGATVSNLYSA